MTRKSMALPKLWRMSQNPESIQPSNQSVNVWKLTRTHPSQSFPIHKSTSAHGLPPMPTRSGTKNSFSRSKSGWNLRARQNQIRSWSLLASACWPSTPTSWSFNSETLSKDCKWDAWTSCEIIYEPDIMIDRKPVRNLPRAWEWFHMPGRCQRLKSIDYPSNDTITCILNYLYLIRVNICSYSWNYIIESMSLSANVLEWSITARK